MKTLLLSISLLVGSQSLHAANSVACAVNGFPPGTGQPVGQVIPCGKAPFDISTSFPKVTISGNTLTISPQVSIGTTSQAITEQYFATVRFHNSFRIPSSPAGDILKFSAAYGATMNTANPGSYVTFQAQIGPGSATSPAITLNPAEENCEFGTCFYTATLPADAFSFITLEGSAGLVALPSQLPGGVETGGQFTFTRFKADGVTPDPFTASPDAASYTLTPAASTLPGLAKARHGRN